MTEGYEKPETVVPVYGYILGVVLVPTWWWLVGVFDFSVNVNTAGTALVIAVAAALQWDCDRQARRRDPEARGRAA